MKKSHIALAAASLAVIASAAFMIRSGSGERAPGDIQLYTVTRSDFIRQITAEGVLEAVKATPIGLPPQVQRPMKIGWIAEDFTVVSEGDVIVRFDSTDFENELNDGTSQRSRTDNQMTKAGTLATATRRNLKRDALQADAELLAAKTFSARDAEIFSLYELLNSEIDEGLAEGKKQFATDVMEIRDRLAMAEREILSIDQRKADLRIRSAQSALDALVMTAPHDGILVLKRDWRGEPPRVGLNVWRGRPIAEIPDLTTMKAEVFALEADAGGINVDQKARVWLESDPSTLYGATVSRVDKMAKPRVRGVPVQYFGVTLDLDQTNPAVMKPGARVRATITLAREEAALTIPRQALFEEKGERFVWVSRGSGFERRAVEIGATSVGRIVITSGLEEGERIALTSPENNGDGTKKSAGATE